MLFRDGPLRFDAGGPPGTWLHREVYDRVVSAARHWNVLVVGEPGSGKTTMLRWLLTQDLGRPVELVDAGVPETGFDLAEAILRKVAPYHERQFRPQLAGIDASPIRQLLAVLPQLTPQVILIDNVFDGTAVAELFGRHRDALWDAGHTWLVAGRARDLALMRRPPADSFFAEVIEIPPLNQLEVSLLLGRGLTPAERNRLKLALPEAPKRPTPRHLIRWAAHFISNGSRSAAVPADLERLTTPQRTVLEALIEIGQASGHDPELQARVGYSRPYLTRLLGQLEREGLVRSVNERTAGQGRPRKVFLPEAG